SATSLPRIHDREPSRDTRRADLGRQGSRDTSTPIRSRIPAARRPDLRPAPDNGRLARTVRAQAALASFAGRPADARQDPGTYDRGPLPVSHEDRVRPRLATH